jgi:hypothetical protein
MAKKTAATKGASAPASRRRASRSGPRSAEPIRSNAPFAVASDGTPFINVGVLESLDDAELSGRAFFIGAELKPAERRRLRERLHEAGDELGAKLAGALASRSAASTKRGSP